MAPPVPHRMVPLVLETVPLPAPMRSTSSVCWSTVNSAVTLIMSSTITVHVGTEPEHTPPDQLVNVEPTAGVAVSSTMVPFGNDEAQVAPQLMPATSLATVPCPVPDLVTVRNSLPMTNAALTVVSPTMVSVQTLVGSAAQSPPQPMNVEPPAAAAVNVTTSPNDTLDMQSAPQLMPPSSEVMVPVPTSVVDAVTVCCVAVKVAETLAAAVTVMTHVAVSSPAHAPPQLANAAPSLAMAFSVTMRPCS
jgi:hypothetical protein